MVGLFLNLASPVVPDLTTAVGTASFPSCAVLPLPLGRYYRSGGTAAYESQYYHCLPSSILFLPFPDLVCCVCWLMLVLSGCFVCSCVWFQVMNILSSKAIVSTPIVQRQSATAHLSRQEVPLVLHLHLNSRRSLPSSHSQRAKLCHK